MMKKTLLVMACMAASAGVRAQQQAAERPQLVVGISIDHLDDARLARYWSNMSQGGFKRLVDEGACIEECRYPYYSTSDLTDVVTVATGAEPVQHGVQGAKAWQPATGKFVMTAFDRLVNGVGGSTKVSGQCLPVTTLADELHENTYGQAKIISIAVDPQISALQIGHSGLALWLDNLKGTWASTTYYASKLPDWVQRKTADDYLKLVWEPKFPPSYYSVYGPSRKYAFKYVLKDVCASGKVYENFATTPMANTAVRELAERAIVQEKLGKDLQPDLLMLHFSLRDFFKTTGKGGFEEEDAYLRLDAELEALMRTLDAQVGKGKWLLYLTGSRTVPDYRRAINPHLQSNSFNSERYAALLNSYLMALYGQNKWVVGCNEGRIYLNRKLVEEKNLSLYAMQEKAVEFFALIPGVADLSTAYRLSAESNGDGTLRFAYSRSSAADLYYLLAPGWYEVDMKGNETGYLSTVDRSVPLYLCGWKIKHAVVRDPVEVFGLSGSLAKWLGLAPPSGSTGVQLPIVVK